jgi:hypothetical protein
MTVAKNCYGAVNYPVTFSDFLLAKTTDASLQTVIESFPQLFDDRTKHLSYPYEVYVRCFQAYMSMQCASLFPTCTNIQSQQAFIPLLGRMPICMDLCLNVFKSCPGFLPADIQGPCSLPSPLPAPFCAFASYTREDAVPPPIGSDTPPPDCPPLDADSDLDDDEAPIETPVLDLGRLPILRTVE